MENTAISITLVLFILSLITEKVSNFIKLNIRSLTIKSPTDSSLEKNREKRIQLLSGLVGIFIALLCKADFFELIRSNGEVKPWQSFDEFNLMLLLGCVITGIFLSQGSKFFHDLLDTLLYYKNMKKAIYNNQEINNAILDSNKNHDADTLVNEYLEFDRDDNQDNNL